MKHTPGKWKIGRALSSTGATPIRNQDGDNIAWVCGADSSLCPDISTISANARLIAAAPEMYEALKAISEEIQAIGFHPNSATAKVWEAIAKAEGLR